MAKGYFKGFNQYEIDGDTTGIYLTDSFNRIVDMAFISTIDLPKLIELNEHYHVNTKATPAAYKYAVTSRYINNKCIQTYLGEVILGVKSNNDYKVKYLNNDTLDNRRANIVFVPQKNLCQFRRKTNVNSQSGVRNVNLVWKYDKYIYRVQVMKEGISYKRDFELNEFEQACEYAEKKRNELYTLEPLKIV